MNEYIFLYALGQYHNIRRLAQGGNQPNLNLTKIKEWDILIPPLDEQIQIVNQVNDIFKATDNVEKRYNMTNAYVDSLEQSILFKAFRGELVPQDPNDEAAAILLEKIKEGRDV